MLVKNGLSVYSLIDLLFPDLDCYPVLSDSTLSKDGIIDLLDFGAMTSVAGDQISSFKSKGCLFSLLSDI